MSKAYFQGLEASKAGSQIQRQAFLAQLQFNEQGLLPAIAQDSETKEVLMLAWANQGAVDYMLAHGVACYFSRSRQKLWPKGETSGHWQYLKELRVDCDGDALLLLVEQHGPACHTNRSSCFYYRLEAEHIVVTADPG